MKKVTFDFPPDFHRQLKVAAAEKGVTMRDIVIRCVEQCLQKDKEPQDR